MKGIVFNLLEEVVSQEHGEDMWDALLDATGLSGVYTSLGDYPTAELMRLVEAASEALDRPADDVVRWFGREAIPLFAVRYPQLFERHDSTRSFLLTLNKIIHPEVRKMYPGAEVPTFDFDFSSPDLLIMRYRSARQLCAFGEGLMQGTARHFEETIRLEHPECMKRGDAHCVFHVSFLPGLGTA